MNGSGCKNCPVKPCHTLHYRGSYCAEQRAKHSLGDPMTNADRIRAMRDEELADWLARTQIANVSEALEVAKIPYEQEDGIKDEVAKECLEWLQQPAGEE